MSDFKGNYNMKKILIICMAMVLLVANIMTGCGKNNSTDIEESTGNLVQSETDNSNESTQGTQEDITEQTDNTSSTDSDNNTDVLAENSDTDNNTGTDNGGNNTSQAESQGEQTATQPTTADEDVAVELPIDFFD